MLITDMVGPRPLDEEQTDGLLEAIEVMEDAGDDRARAVVRARQVLAIDPACAPAILVLAENASTSAERIALLKEVISVWKRSFRPTGYERVDWWRHPADRTVMAALAELGDALEEVGDQDGAATCFRVLLKLDPEDRYMAALELERTQTMAGGRRA